MENMTMLTDLCQLTMDVAYLDNDKDDIATFDLFVRNLPPDWGYFIANGIEEAIDYATNIKFEEDDIEDLRRDDLFSEEFFEFLRHFKFEGEIYAVKEGTPVAPDTPILRVTAKRTQSQFVESTLENILNFQTMIASKASRIVNAAKEAKVVDFGLRRAQGYDAAMKGARAAYIAGAVSTSNVKAGKEYKIPRTGTHAHSFVMTFKSEIDAFRAYVKTFPKNTTLLIDTYDTENGARNAAIVAKELEAKGKMLGAVRLDSGDLCDLSKKVREILDKEGLSYVKIFASNDLNEYKMESLVRNGARIDGYGVGTEMITAKPDAAISGVYKLVEDNDGGKIKLSEGKRSYPGNKQVYRILDKDGNYLNDRLVLEGESVEGMPLLELVVKNGQRVQPRRTLPETREYTLSCMKKMPEETKRVIAEPYKVEISSDLKNLVESLTEKYGRQAK